MSKITKRKELYNINKLNKVGDICICPICKNEFKKKQYSQAFCCNECKVKFHNDKQVGKRNEYHRKYNMKYPKRYDRVGIDIEFEKWKERYYFESDAWGAEIPSCEITQEELIRQYEEQTGNIYKGDY